MASAQTWRNNDRNWSPPYMLTVGIWTGFLVLLSKKLEHQALFLSCGLEFFPYCYLTADSGLSPRASMPYTVLNWTLSLCGSIRWPGPVQVYGPVPSRRTMLSSRKIHGRIIQVSAYLCNVTALGIAPRSMLRNSVSPAEMQKVHLLRSGKGECSVLD